MTEDLYAVLGVPRDVDLGTLKAAYRKRAWSCHPDRNSTGEGHAAFQRLSEAYSVLSASERRAAYDRGLAEIDRSARRRDVGPIRCSECGKVAAQPRILVFRSVRSFLVVSKRIRIEGVFCGPCARRTALRASFHAAVAGWWALPFGPAFTLSAIFANARGGTRHQQSDQRLVLINSNAFLARDQPLLAYALAQQVKRSASGSIKAEAHRLVAQLEARGAPAGVPLLKDPWRPRRSDLAAHAAMASAVPLLAALAVLIGVASQ